MAITSGVYEIAPYNTPTNRVDIASASKEPMANVRYWTPNDTNAQKFYVVTDSLYSSVNKIKNVNSGLLLDVEHGTMANSTNVMQYPDWGDSDLTNKKAQRWYIDTTTDTVSSLNGTNNETVTCKKLRNYKNQSFVLDSVHGQTTHGSNIMIYTDWVSDAINTPAQRFAFYKSSVLDETLSTAYNIGFSDSMETAGSTLIDSTDTMTTYYQAWESKESNFQYRTRIKRRYNGTNTWTSWSAWLGGPALETSDSGWGDAWNVAPATAAGESNVWHGAGMDIINQTSYDASIFQLEVRAANPTGSSEYGLTHGNSVSSDIFVAQTPDASIDSVYYGSFGLEVRGSTTYPRDDNRISNLVVELNGEALCEPQFLAVAKSSWLVTIPFDELKFIPDDGQACTVSYDFSTVDNTYAKSITSSITYDDLWEAGTRPMMTTFDGYAMIAQMDPTNELTHMSIHYLDNGKKVHKSLRVTNSMALFYPPLNTEYTLEVVVRASNGFWSTYKLDLDGPVCPYLVWNWPVSDWSEAYTVLAVGKGDSPQVSSSLTRDYAAALTTGAEYESVDFGHGSSRALTASGSIVPALKLEGSDLESVEALSTAGKVTFRLPSGQVYEVAVTGASTTLQGTKDTAVTVNMIVTN